MRTLPKVSTSDYLEPNPYANLLVPTQITKIGEDYFLVDCYHNQILTATSLDTPLSEWCVLSDQINRGHTIAGNGNIYMADDTENNRVLIFKKIKGFFSQVQCIENVGIRPHYVEYDETTKRFYVLSSMSGELYVFYQDAVSSDICLEKIMSIPDMQNVYIRSFTLDGNEIYFAANNGTILRATLDNLTILETWHLPPELAGLIQVKKIQDYYYITISTDINGDVSYATIIRVRNLNDLAEYDFEELYSSFNSTGTPYYITAFDDHYYLAHHCYLPGHGIWQFDVVKNEMRDIKVMYP